MQVTFLIEYTVLSGPFKGKRVKSWIDSNSPEAKRLLEDPNSQGKVIDKVKLMKEGG